MKQPFNVRTLPDSVIQEIQLPMDQSVQSLLNFLIGRLNLPTHAVGSPIRYVLQHVSSGQFIDEGKTLADCGVAPFDMLAVLPTLTAGNPRLRRLQSDYERLRELESQSDLIRIVATDGNPPEKYVIEFFCRGIERLDGGKPIYRERHQLGIVLPSDYPSAKPGLTFLTPIFHPNIESKGWVCIGPWYASKWLDELVFMVAEMIQYKIPPTRDTESDVVNLDAVRWLKRHRHMLPVDNRDIRSVGDDFLDSIKIGWSSTDDDDLLGRIRIG